MTDEFTKEGSAIDVGGYPPAARVIEVLSRLVSEFGASTAFRRDNEPFLDRRTVDRLCVDGVNKPWQNGLDGEPQWKFHEECLNLEWFPPVPKRTSPSRNHGAFAAPVVQQGRALTYQTPHPHAPLPDPLRAASEGKPPQAGCGSRKRGRSAS
jgi:hypothetical protein